MFRLYETTIIIEVCWQLASRIRTEPVPSWSCSQAVWHIPLLCVQWKTPDDGQRNCPKHVLFYSKNTYKKLVHLVGCVIRIYHDARSPERQKKFIIINIMDWTLWSVPSPELQLLAPTLLRSSNCRPSLWSVVVRFQSTTDHKEEQLEDRRSVGYLYLHISETWSLLMVVSCSRNM